MMRELAYALRAFARAGLRNAAYALGIALAVALFSGTLFFVDRSAGEMTQRALAPVLIDFQARALDPGADPALLLPQLRSQPGITDALPIVSLDATISSASSSDGVGIRLFAIQPEYLLTFPVLTVSSGAFDPTGVLVSEQMAARLGLRAGDPLVLGVPGVAAPYATVVSGTVSTDQSEPLFTGPGLAPEGAYGVASAVVVMDYGRFTRDLSAEAQAVDEEGNRATGARKSLPRLDRQVNLRMDRASLPADPGAAATRVSTLTRTLERQASGQIKVLDNVAATLASAQRDVISARLLFVFLGLPGILLAAVLAQQAAASAMEAQRRDLALLRARGMSPSQMVGIVIWTALLTASIGAIVGIVLGAIGAFTLFGTAAPRHVEELVPMALVALAFGVLLGAAGAFLPARRLLTADIGEARRSLRAGQRPIWLRMPLDLALLAAAALALWFSSTYNSRAATASAGETASVSLGAYAFVGPLLFWFGAALLFLRIMQWLLRKSPGPWPGGLAGLAHRSLHRRPDRSASAALLLGLATSFGVASIVFAATFEASRRQDARYVVGSDVRVTFPINEAQPASFGETLTVPGVQAVTPVIVAGETLVGNQLQTVYGVDLASLSAATTMADDFFVEDTAQAVINRLRATPNGVLVNVELAATYNIVNGDNVAVRIPKVNGGYTDARLPVMGIFYVFPTGPHNSDLIVNAAFLTAATENPAAGFFLLKTDGSEQTNAQVAASLAQRLRGSAVRIQTAEQAVSQDQSSLVGVNLAGLVALNRLYAALVIALGFGVFLLGAIVERARELGTLEALGAMLRQVINMLVLEGGVLVVAGLVGGFAIGVPLAWQYNGFLPGIFSVARPVLSVPLADIGVLLLLALVGVALAAGFGALRLRRLWPAEVLRDL
jgi:putative ABC transport system permease protein